LQPASGRAPHEEVPGRISLGEKLLALAVVVLSFIGLPVAVALFWGRGISWLEGGLLLAMCVVTARGLTVAFQCLFIHPSFEAGAAVRFVLAALGAMALQAPLLKWLARHRHQHSGPSGDPYSPCGHDSGVLGR
jgi:stearoyl-CoA desaturase (delta-9 desaturase)